MATTKSKGEYENRLALYEKVIATQPAIERKGKTFPYTSHNGNMFTLLNQSGTMALRLPEDAREKFLKQHKTELFVSHGALMKEYVTVPDVLLKDTATMRKYLSASYEYVKTLKVKPTKKSAPKGRKG